MERPALGIIDAQRGFMPAREGERLGVKGFGELPVNDSESIVAGVNQLLTSYAIRSHVTFTTQDWHPVNTAHFSSNPNFTTTWPLHCVAGTPGAELHPEITVPSFAIQFKKGMEPLINGEDDISYSGYNSFSGDGQSLGEFLTEKQVTAVVLGGLALDYCVGKTALDLRAKLDLDVIVAIDATGGIADESVHAMLDKFVKYGIRTMTVDQVLAWLED
jgi:nicotinamidase/pyrazinamidase